MDFKICFLIFLVTLFNITSGFLRLGWEPANPSLDTSVIDKALNSTLCREQINYLRRSENTVLRLTFMEAGMRLPRGMLTFNNLDMGNYDQCLGVYRPLDESVIEGKYCMIRGPLDRTFSNLAEAMQWSDFDLDLLSNNNLDNMREIEALEMKLAAIRGNGLARSVPGEISFSPTFRMALCIPKSCTTQEGMTGIYLLNFTQLFRFHYEEEYCRVVGDKPYAPVDYLAIALFSFIGFVTILSTSYDVWCQFVEKKDQKEINAVLRSFSVYTNGKRLTSFSSNPNNLNCVDGIRAISMFYIIVGHTYILMPPTYNNTDVITWIIDLKSLWITAAPYAVDTFFFLSGLLVTYTTVGKLSGAKLLKNLHLFYLNRLLRMFPLLAAVVLLQASILNIATDGPNWLLVAANTNNCRNYWWATLLYIQNYIGYDEQCINHSWYLAIDMHCYIVCPLVLYWVLNGNKKHAWIALTCGLLVVLTGATIYSFLNQFGGWILVNTRGWGPMDYHYYFYFNTLTRASPFFVGMIFGYLFNIWKDQKPNISKILAVFLWCCNGVLAFLLMYVTHLMKDSSWDTFIINDLVNSFARPLWAMTIGWVIFACQYGYGGPVNWFLSLDIWKLPSRISYAIYLFHFQMQFVIQATARAPIFFSDALALHEFMSQAVIAFGIAFGLTLIIDSPISVLIKLMLGDGPKKPKKELPDKE